MYDSVGSARMLSPKRSETNLSLGWDRASYAAAASRAFDLAIAIVGLALVAPLMVVLAVAIWAGDRGPVLFQHSRLGKNGRSFKCLKFRSMRCDGDRILQEYLASNADARIEWAETRKLRNDPRVSPLGRFLRASSLDELPQLFNVLLGDMAIVGPRPIVPDELVFYGAYARFYFAVRPGITGLWQVSGRSGTSYRRRVTCDVVYVRSKSVRLDAWITLLTLPAVLFRKGAW